MPHDLKVVEPKPDRLAAIQEKRRLRQEGVQAAKRDQLAIDLEAIDEAEAKYGDESIGVLDMPFTEGLPVKAAVRAANPAELKRYRARVKPSKRGELDSQVALDAAVELGITCQVYPEPKSDTDVAMRAARPGCDAQLGLIALRLGGGEEEREGKG